MDDFEAFARLVTALRPWLGQLVVVGGWAHRLYQSHPQAAAPRFPRRRPRSRPGRACRDVQPDRVQSEPCSETAGGALRSPVAELANSVHEEEVKIAY